jgi:hypothetical protein
MSVKRAAILSLALLWAGACTGASSGQGADEDREVAIYTAVIGHMTSEKGQASGFRVIYVLDRVMENADDPDDPGTGRPLPEKDQAALRDALAEVAPVEFVSSREQVTGPESEGSRVEDEGIFLTLGPIGGEGDRALVPASSYLGNLAGTWQTWVVERRDEGWTVTGTEGPVAIS